MKWSARWNPIPWLAAAVAIMALACGGDSEQTGAGSATKSMPRGPKSPMPSERTWGTELPENFPEDVPRFPGARITKIRVSADQDLAVSFNTDEDVDEVVDYFADSFAAEGWSTQVRDMPRGRAVFADKDLRVASVMSSQGDEGTLIELRLYEVR